MQSASFGVSPKASRVELVFCECDEQAEPDETQIPFDERKWSIVSLFMLGKVTLRICDT